MDLIPEVSQTIAIVAIVISLGLALNLFAVALARWSVDFFKG